MLGLISNMMLGLINNVMLGLISMMMLGLIRKMMLGLISRMMPQVNKLVTGRKTVTASQGVKQVSEPQAVLYRSRSRRLLRKKQLHSACGRSLEQASVVIVT